MIRASAEVIRASAWPAVAVSVLYFYREDIRKLIPRVRELPFGTKIDPQAQQPPPPSGSPIEQIESIAVPNVRAAPESQRAGQLPENFERLRTPDVLLVEQAILQSLDQSSVIELPSRVRALSTLAAILFRDWNFERIDGSIWRSQLQLIEALNTVPMPKDAVKSSYYDKAAAAFPGWFSSYSFDGYLGFLSSNSLLAENAGVISITQMGRDYLVWRVRQRKVMKALG